MSGFMVVNTMGAFLLPKDNDIEGYIKDENWRIIYGFPILLNIIMLTCFWLFIKKDSIIFCLS